MSVTLHVIETRLRDQTEMEGVTVQQASMRVLTGANMPAVLIEMGYLSNPNEERALASALTPKPRMIPSPSLETSFTSFSVMEPPLLPRICTLLDRFGKTGRFQCNKIFKLNSRSMRTSVSPNAM